ncbi:MAG: hypothetical protein AAF402_00165 [Pseudomonadota bacterium]
MRNDTAIWSAPRNDSQLPCSSSVAISAAPALRQVLLSGPKVRAQMNLQVVEWPDIISTERYALSIRRDRIMLVNGPEMIDGWDDELNQAISDVSDAYRVFDISSESLLEFLRRGAEIDLSLPSASVSRLWFGISVLLYRINENTARVHVPSAQADALLNAISAVIG